MTTLTDIREQLTRLWQKKILILFGLLFLASIVILGSWWWQAHQPKPPFGLLVAPQIVEADLGEGQSTLYLRISEADLKGLPREAPVYRVKIVAWDETERELIAQRFGFKGKGEKAFDAFGNEACVWADPPQILSITPYGRLSFSASTGAVRIEKAPKNVTEAAALAESLINKYSLSAVNLGAKKVVLIQVPGEGTGWEVSDWEKATYIEVGWSGEVGSYQLFHDGYGESYLFIRLAKDGSLLQLEFLTTEVEESENYLLKSVKEIKNALAAGEGKLVYVEGNTQPKSIFLTGAKLALFQESNKEYLQPIFVFEGKSGDGKAFVLFLPAVSSKWMK